MTLGMVVSMTLGTTDMQDGTADSGVRITADGTVAGILSGRECIRDIIWDRIRDITSLYTWTHGEDQDTRQDRTGCMRAGPPAAEDLAHHRLLEETFPQVRPEQFQELQPHLPAPAASAGP